MPDTMKDRIAIEETKARYCRFRLGMDMQPLEKA